MLERVWKNTMTNKIKIAVLLSGVPAVNNKAIKVQLLKLVYISVGKSMCMNIMSAMHEKETNLILHEMIYVLV